MKSKSSWNKVYVTIQIWRLKAQFYSNTLPWWDHWACSDKKTHGLVKGTIYEIIKNSEQKYVFDSSSDLLT